MSRAGMLSDLIDRCISSMRSTTTAEIPIMILMAPGATFTTRKNQSVTVPRSKCAKAELLSFGLNLHSFKRLF